MDETRNNGRTRTILGAQIIFNNRNSTIECQIRNFSVSGARLALTESVALPEEFEIFVPQKGRSYQARLRWRDATGLGVEFIGEDAARPAQPPGPDFGRRVAELEAENETLRRKLLELTERLENERAA